MSSFLSFIPPRKHGDRRGCRGEDRGIRPGVGLPPCGHRLGLASKHTWQVVASSFTSSSLEANSPAELARPFFQCPGTPLCGPGFPVLPSVHWPRALVCGFSRLVAAQNCDLEPGL